MKFRKSCILLIKNWIKYLPGKNPVKSREQSERSPLSINITMTNDYICQEQKPGTKCSVRYWPRCTILKSFEIRLSQSSLQPMSVQGSRVEKTSVWATAFRELKRNTFCWFYALLSRVKYYLRLLPCTANASLVFCGPAPCLKNLDNKHFKPLNLRLSFFMVTAY